jgi:hypothetical protein
MSYVVDDVEFHLSNTINAHWYSKFKKQLRKHHLSKIKQIIADAKQKKKQSYSARYYACAKFVKATTHLRYKKEQRFVYWVRTMDGDLIDTYTVANKSDLCCVYQHRLVLDADNRWGGRSMGMCTNKCCHFFRRPDKFAIQWL